MKEKRLNKSAGGTNQLEATIKDFQKPVINFLRTHPVSIVLGMAGMGKDFLQLYRAVDGLIRGEFEHIVISKPIVEIGAGIGFLPGEINDKSGPYQKSFYENLVKIAGKAKATDLKSKITFEHVGFLRGNTFPEKSVIILSEVQNLTLHEIISFVTRLPESSKLFINGDKDQIDIRKSGLKDFLTIIENVKGIEVMELGEEFQMRHPLIVNLTKEYRKFKNEGTNVKKD